MNMTIKLAALSAMVAALTGCGGGGGTSAPPPPPPAATLAITSVTNDGATALSVNATFDGVYITSGDVGTVGGTVALTCDAQTVNAAVTVNTAAQTFRITTDKKPYAATCTLMAKLTGKAIDASKPIGFKTELAPIKLFDKVYATYTGFYPFSVTKTGVGTVKNMTGYNDGARPLSNCRMYEVWIEEGLVPVKCTVSADKIERKFYIDPETDELHVYTGTFVFDESLWHMIPWGTATPYAKYDIGTQGSYAEVDDGIFSIKWSDTQTMVFYSAGFASVTPVATGRFDVEGTFGVVIGYKKKQ